MDWTFGCCLLTNAAVPNIIVTTVLDTVSCQLIVANYKPVRSHVSLYDRM